jgi:hypothetical protein
MEEIVGIAVPVYKSFFSIPRLGSRVDLPMVGDDGKAPYFSMVWTATQQTVTLPNENILLFHFDQVLLLVL